MSPQAASTSNPSIHKQINETSPNQIKVSNTTKNITKRNKTNKRLTASLITT